MNHQEINQRKEKLKKFSHVISLHENDIIEALHKDFGKPAFEAYLTEINVVQSDLKDTIKNIHAWAKPKKVRASILNFPSSDYIYTEPYGKTLIISPWNYPFQLAICPLIAAYAAGNSIVLKPSELTPHTSSLISKIIRETFDVKEVVAVLGDAEIAKSQLAKRWDYIFFTGSPAVGKEIAKAAAGNLTPVTLELGGKNPCIIDKNANLQIAAKRIVWGKFINAGQTCIAPDYLLIHKGVKTKFIRLLQQEIINAYGEDPKLSPDFTRIINKKHFLRLVGMIDEAKTITGGIHDEESLYIAPTLIDEPSFDSAIMKDEIFGPLLPLISYENESDLEKIISKYEKPLSLYVFTDDKAFAERAIRKFSFGGGCINDTVVHFSNKRLPFGGVGNSGMGAYHGKKSYDTFSHQKAIVKKATWLDIPLRYAPYGNKLKVIRKLLKWL
ncbi:MAG: aldehyde dehydrogenase [Flavobacterium sp.]|uniref:aldehyde dehydrogenase n=1 Tax=Flavobacterium sp. Leaf359 TaxID=1736351 RepID=UPI0006F240CD|nr:aldehyde dehydrogenase [Flavobacterium sp. Leaf359]KQS53593.1 aldehyde dehydrogenase [Flavobacterium sp. Leaf359]MBU7571449.1 aldehyde dehydrogenase [Flavobacterium sp.]PZO33288.1 MAG: aldehyde dehydrogenase [Flavobacteriaceae bacterium]